MTTGVVCNDGNACTTDSCDPGSGCKTTRVVCDDGNVCTDNSCNTESGCAFTPNTAPCNDGNARTRSDACSDGSCVCGSPPNCDDENVCTDNSCNPATGCVFPNNSAPCDYGKACTTSDVCVGGTCMGSLPANCNDNKPCTIDSSNDSTGCVNKQVACGGMHATICGTSGSNIIDGTGGPDIIHGLEGNDFINGSGGNDKIYGGDICSGGSGIDTASNCEFTTTVT